MKYSNERFFLVLFLVSIFIPGLFGKGNDLPPVKFEFQGASVITNENKLIVSTGKMNRSWEWTGHGFVTVSLKDLESKREWCSIEPGYSCDWSFPGLIDNSTIGSLISLSANLSNDDEFTSDHIEVIAEIHYETMIAIQYIIWIYPDAPGVRTQLKVKSLHGMNQTKAQNNSTRNEYIPINWNGIDRHAIGYYNNTQKRNAANLRLLKEELSTGSVVQPEKYDWNNILIAEDNDGGLIFVEESHKCVNQEGLFSGYFNVDQNGLSTTGWGLQVQDIISERFRACWANWCIVYSGKESYSSEFALKRFDRLRYPVNPDLDIYILANTWGSGNQSDAAREENVIVEINTQAELGIDVQQIDEGWQNPKNFPWYATTKWETHPDRYPEGWKNVVSLAEEKKMKLGIWFSIGNLNDDFQKRYGDNWYAGLNDFKRSYDKGKFTYYKFDMANLESYDELELAMNNAREFVKYTDHKIRINWDVTENEPRTGYFFGRELGNVFLANRTTEKGRPTIYIPYLVLRDAWQVSKYINLNKFQISIQNIDRTDQSASNAHLYNHPYSVAIALMGSPLFFQETHYYSEEAKEQIKSLLKIYKENREEMFKGYVFPIGDEPNDKNWTGFQNHIPASNEGYLLIFRELNNKEKNHTISLNFLAGQTIKFSNLTTGKSFTAQAGKNGNVQFTIKNPADFLYLKYNIK